MKHRTLWVVIGMTVGLLLSGIALPARADIGPKPSMDFTFVAATDVQPDIVAAVLYECTDPSCADAQPLPEIGPQGFTCQARSCHSLAYGYADYLRLRVRFSDGVTRESNVFSKRAFQARYTVTIEPTSLQVKEQVTPGAGFNGPLGALLLLGTAAFLLPLLVLWIIWSARGGKDTAPSSWLLIATWGISHRMPYRAGGRAHGGVDGAPGGGGAVRLCAPGEQVARSVAHVGRGSEPPHATALVDPGGE